MGHGHQGVVLFKEHRSPNGTKCNRIIQKIKDRNIAIRFNNHNVIGHFGFHQWQWIGSLNIYEEATVFQTPGLALGIKVNKKSYHQVLQSLKSTISSHIQVHYYILISIMNTNISLYKNPVSVMSKMTRGMTRHQEVHGTPLSPPIPHYPWPAGWPMESHRELGWVAAKWDWLLESSARQTSLSLLSAGRL